MYAGRKVKYPLLLSDFNETWISLDRFSKNSQNHVGAEFHADRLIDMTKLIVAFRNFANSLKKWAKPGNLPEKKVLLKKLGHIG